jgi:eukaryotic-like serine/threonine-protein kinase
MPPQREATAKLRGQRLGRYVLYDEIAAGGMASVHIARMLGPAGFTRTVAIKKLHAQYAKDPEFVAMFLDEARLAARVHHPNVVPMLDVVARDGELFLVMDYVRGESLARLLSGTATAEDRPLAVLAAMIADTLAGLHAAHEAKNEQGADLAIVHRDVSPQNVLVGLDGVARVLDFGIAKAAIRLHSTRDGQIKGKLRYMAPEQIMQRPVDRRTDVYAAAVVAWEVLAGRRLFLADEPGAIVKSIVDHEIPRLQELSPRVPAELDAVVRRGLALEPDERFATALEMAEALERVVQVASPREVGAWVRRVAHAALDKRAAVVALIEQSDPEEPLPRGGDEAVALPEPRSGIVEATGVTSVGRGALTEDATTSTGSSLSGDVARPVAPARPPRWPGAAAAALVVVVMTAAWIAIDRRGRHPDEADASPPPRVASSGGAASAGPPPTATAKDDATASATASAASDSAAPPAARASAPASPEPPSRRAPPAKPAANHEKKPGCDPPYRIEADGTKVFKAGCL